jgi:hypothetical protein
MAIRLDFTQETVVVVCDKCPSWRALRVGRTAAWGAASQHEKDAHEGERQASLAYGMSRQRDLQANLDLQAQRLSPYVSS